MLTDDWRGGRTSLYEGESEESAGEVQSWLQTHRSTHTGLPTRHHPGCSPSIFTVQRLQRSRAQQKAGQGWKWLLFVFSACLYIESADRSGRGGGEADGRMRKWQLALFNGLHVIILRWIFQSELLQPSVIPPRCLYKLRSSNLS